MAEQSVNNRWNELLRIIRSWRVEWHLKDLLARVAKESSQFMNMDRCAVLLLEPRGVVCQAIWPLDADASDAVEIGRKVAQNGRPVFGQKVGKSSMRTVGCIPLTANRGILGALYFDTAAKNNSFTRQDEEIAGALALQAAASLDQAILYQSAITDPLTGLFSHRHFQQEVEQAVRRAQRTGKRQSLVMIDLDHFKELNDSSGHEAGNECLIRVAAILKDSIRNTDVIARFGGDEFEILLADSVGADALRIAEKIRTKIGALRSKHPVRVTATMGIATYPDNAGDAQGLFLRADEALYSAKEAGRNRCHRSTTKPAAAENGSSKVLKKPEPPVLAPLSTPGFPRIDVSATEMIDGHKLIRRLGVGSTGEVFLVQQPELERNVALKRLLTPHLTSEQQQAFEREARVTAGLEHPGVVTIHTMGSDADGRQYYTMKPLRGTSLADVLKDYSRNDASFHRINTQRRLLEILQRVAETISHAHGRGIVHLDLTPQNIIVGEFGEVTVIDWGSGASSTPKKTSSRKGASVLALGTPGRTAPEQLLGAFPTGPHTDVHAMGALLYEILTGQNPYVRETTSATMSAVKTGRLELPEKLAPKAGIEPGLSKLCMSALSRDPAQRPSAAEFSARLGRYVRCETESMCVVFGSGAHKLRVKDWLVVTGRQAEWEIRGNEWVSRMKTPAILLWNQSIPGNFRFECEAWAGQMAELCLVGRRTLNPYQHITDGIAFQFSAEWNTGTKLAHTYGSQHIDRLIMKPRQRYRMVLEYRNGWITCLLDGRKLFEFREMYHYFGDRVGIRTCSPGVHFRPIQLEWENWGGEIPAMHVADQLASLGQHERALDLYRNIVNQSADRLEGFEARFKCAACLLHLNRHREAASVAKMLKGTPVEPFALAEQAHFFAQKENAESFRKAAGLMRTLLKRFPDADARVRVRYPICNQSFSRLEPHRADILHSMRRANSGQMQVWLHSQVLASLARLGQWKRALHEALEFDRKLDPALRAAPYYHTWQYAIMLAAGREDLLPRDPFELRNWSMFKHDWYGGVAEHLFIRRRKAASLVSRWRNGWRPDRETSDEIDLARLWTALAAGELREAEALIELLLEKRPQRLQQPAFASVLAGCDHPELQEKWLVQRERRRDLSGKTPYAQYFRGRRLLESMELKEAARLFADIDPFFRRYLIKDLALCEFLLGSLGLLPGLTRRKLKRICEEDFVGPSQDLGRMLLKLKAPVPSALWPHPLWHPEWRLWLALWLEAQGKHKAARAVAEPAVDSRYGLTHSQPALRRLLQRAR